MKESNAAIEVLKTAILLERRGKAFYTQAARQSESKSASKIFEMMAEEEDARVATGQETPAFRATGDSHVAGNGSIRRESL